MKEASVMQNIIDYMSKFTNSYKNLETKNKNIQNEVTYLKKKNDRLEKENQNLWSYLKSIVKVLKKIFRNVLQVGKKEEKDTVVTQVKSYYNNELYDKDDVYDVAVDTSKEKELFKYADIDKGYDTYNKDDFDIEI